MRVGAEHVDHVAHIRRPLRNVALVSRGRVVADLELAVEAGCVVARHNVLEAPDPRLAIRPEQAVHPQHHLLAGRRQRVQCGHVL